MVCWMTFFKVYKTNLHGIKIVSRAFSGINKMTSCQGYGLFNEVLIDLYIMATLSCLCRNVSM